MGIAVKSAAVPLTHIITGPLYIPGGTVAGGIYMLFPVLAASLTGKRGAALLCGFCQGILVFAIGMSGSHGILSIVSYSLTGLAIDLVMLVLRHRGCCLLCCFFGGMAANVTGTLIVSAVFFGMPPLGLALIASAGALSGSAGGALAWMVTKQLRKLGVVK